jgi:peptidoglycan/LPS O-acetylase OafA/YrhL
MTALLISLAFNKAGALVAAKLTGLTPAVGMPPGFGLPLLGDLFALAYLATVVVVSWITYRLIEMPARAWFNRLSTRI